MWVIPALVVALLVVAALADRHNRRAGRVERTKADYWHAAADDRKQVRQRMRENGRRFGR